jgi:hypothetical protein
MVQATAVTVDLLLGRRACVGHWDVVGPGSRVPDWTVLRRVLSTGEGVGGRAGSAPGLGRRVASVAVEGSCRPLVGLLHVESWLLSRLADAVLEGALLLEAGGSVAPVPLHDSVLELGNIVTPPRGVDQGVQRARARLCCLQRDRVLAPGVGVTSAPR